MTPTERAHIAQMNLYEALSSSGGPRDHIDALLRSALSTAEIVKPALTRTPVEHKGFAQKHPELYADIEARLWSNYQKGSTPDEMLRMIAALIRDSNVEILAPEVIGALLERQQSASTNAH